MIPKEFNQEKVNQILLREGSLRELKPFFPNQEAILNYHAQRMTELFPPNKNTSECEYCHRHSVELQGVFEWRGIYHTTDTAIISTVGIAVAIAISHHLFHFLMPSKQVSFSTTHGLCGNCFEQMKRRRMFASIIKQLCLTFIVISAVIFTSVIVFTVYFLLPQPTESSIIYAALGYCGGFLFLAGGLLGTDQIARWCLPKSLKLICKPPFQLVGFRK
jgi:hypothetical protein